MNELTIVGNLTADPTYRMSANGRGVIRFYVAVNRRRFDREASQYVDFAPVFHRVLAFGLLAENANKSLQRGLEVVVVGTVVDDSYEKDAEKRRQQVLEAQVIAPSLRFGSAKFTKVQQQEPHQTKGWSTRQPFRTVPLL
jgi:single-strand DNA-binding protein